MSEPLSPTPPDVSMPFLEHAFVTGNYISGLGYGIQLILYYQCACHLWQNRKAQKQYTFLPMYITLLLLIKGVFEVSSAWMVQSIYLDNRDFPGGPWIWFLTAAQNTPLNVVSLTSLLAVTFLADLIVFWRCWVIYAAFARWVAVTVMIFPTIILVSSLGVGIVWIYYSISPSIELATTLSIALGTSYWTLSLSYNIILTILIVTRLLLYRRNLLSSIPNVKHAADAMGGKDSPYVGIATVVVESAMLFSVFALIFLITYAIDHPINVAFMTAASAAQQISNYLIIYRLAVGRGWRSSTASGLSGTASGTQVTTMSFGSSDIRWPARKKLGLDNAMASQFDATRTLNDTSDSHGSLPWETREGSIEDAPVGKEMHLFRSRV